MESIVRPAPYYPPRLTGGICVKGLSLHLPQSEPLSHFKQNPKLLQWPPESHTPITFLTSSLAPSLPPSLLSLQPVGWGELARPVARQVPTSRPFPPLFPLSGARFLQTPTWLPPSNASFLRRAPLVRATDTPYSPSIYFSSHALLVP